MTSRASLAAKLLARLREDEPGQALSNELKDPEQNMEVKTGTSVDQLTLALNTIDSELMVVDGEVLTEEMAKEASDAMDVLRRVVDSIQTKLAANKVEHGEADRSEGLA